MMTKIFTVSFMIFVAYRTLACEVTLPSNLLVIGDSPDFNQVIEHRNCDQETLDQISSTLSSVDGKILSYQLAEILKNKVINIKPAMLQVQQLKHLMREQLNIPTGIQLRSLSPMNTNSVLALATGDKVELECSACLYGLQQPVNVKIQGFDGIQKSLVVRADFKKMVRAFKVQTFHPAFSEIAADALNEEFVESIPHTDLLTELDHLKFYKLNKPIKAGTYLRKSDLNALNLVKAGVKTEVVIENQLLKLKTHGISRSNGTLGDFVEVFHPQKNKKYLGKVIDINKVLVEL